MYMAKYVAKRLAFALLVFIIIISVAFLLIRLLPNVDAKQFGKDMELVNQSRYRSKNIPTAGAILKEEDSSEKQITFEM